LTIPISPNFATSRRGKYESELISTEQMKLMQLQERQEEFRRERERAQLRKQQALYGAPMQAVRSEKPLTEPEEFSFATSARFGPAHSYSRDPETPPSQKKKKLSEDRSLSITVPEPFQFATDTRHRKIRQSIGEEAMIGEGTPSRRGAQPAPSAVPAASPWVPLKQRLRELENATPEHWKKQSRPRSPVKPLVLTKPIEPTFQTAMRSHSRPSIVEEAPVTSHAFKAHPLNRKILESSGDLGVLRVVKRPLTQPQSPKLRVASLASRRPSVAELREREEREAAQKRIFKALPVGGAVPESPRRAHAAAPKPLTVATSPNLHTKQRSHLHVVKPAPSPKTVVTFKARPMPNPNATPKRRSVAPEPPKLTIPEPFALATEERSYLEEQRRLEALERERRELEAKREFKARPIPNSVPFRPHLELKVTEPEPFALRSGVLHDAAQQELEEKLAKERQDRLAKSQFKARPVPKAKPMEVSRSMRPLTEITSFALNTDNRSQQREVFEQRKAEKEQLAKMQEERRAALEAERQKQEIQRMRQQLVHKALPLPASLHTAPAPVRGSCQPLTEPKTPKFHTTTRRIRPTH
jgi:targeting protein for Xklp2